jgi:hypothetical protein
MLGGLGLVIYGLRGGYFSWGLGVNHPEKSLRWMLGFRQVMIGLAVIGVGAAWWWQLGWLLALALIIGGEETLESSICIFALREQRSGRNLTSGHRRTLAQQQGRQGENLYVRGSEGACSTELAVRAVAGHRVC